MFSERSVKFPFCERGGGDSARNGLNGLIMYTLKNRFLSQGPPIFSVLKDIDKTGGHINLIKIRSFDPLP